VEGSSDVLGQLKSFKVIFTYNKMAFCDKPGINEYVQEKIAGLSPVDAQIFISKWNDDFRDIFEVAYKNSINRRLKKKNVVIDVDADIALVVMITKIEHHNHFFKKSKSQINGYCFFVDDAGAHLLAYYFTAYGSMERSETQRVEELFLVAGDLLGKKMRECLKARELETR
jgi:hypothetical protein